MNRRSFYLSVCTFLILFFTADVFAQKATNPSKKDANENQRSSQNLVGNVGIDVPNPLTKLHVAGEIRIEDAFAFFEADGTAGNSGYCMRENGATKAYLYWLASQDVLKLNANLGSGNHITIKPEGTVGIGTISDSARLHIQGLTSTTGHTVDVDDSSGNSLFTIKDNGNIGINFPNPGVKLAVDGGMNLYNESTFYGQMYHSAGDLFMNGKFGFFLFPGPSIPAQDIILQATSGPIFGFSGLVGIGTNDPQAKLHVSSNMMIGTGVPAAGYALSVNGKIMAEEVRVQLDTDWPDYVFEKGYPLMPLKETAKFIQSNQHLPGIPSAAEVETSGIQLGEMNRLLLEKVEELTLHIIQLSEEVQILKENQK